MRTKILGYALALSTIVPASAAQATQTLNVTMQFQSGASFVGTVDFTDDFSSYTDVAGTLFGYEGGYYTGTGSTAFTWVWDNVNWSSGVDNFSNWLMDGTPGGSDYNTAIQLAYNYSDPNNLTFTNGVSWGGFDNYISYVDPMVEGSFGQSQAVPEPSTWAMMLFGFFGLGLAIRRHRAQRPVASFA